MFFSIAYVLLLLNVFVVKDLHYLVELTHDHAHDHIDKHENCTSDVHFHDYSHHECSICDFTFSPTEEESEISFSLSTPVLDTAATLFYNTIKLSNTSDRSLYLRGPPIFSI